MNSNDIDARLIEITKQIALLRRERMRLENFREKVDIANCPVCGKVFHRLRKDKRTCSRQCSTTLAVREFRERGGPKKRDGHKQTKESQFNT